MVAVEVLGYRIGGQYITLEKDLSDLQQEQVKLKLISTTLVKAIFTVMDGSYRTGGPTEGHEKLTDKYIESISKFLDPDIIEQWNKDIDDIHKNP